MARILSSAAYRIAIATSAAFTLSTILLGAAVYFNAHRLFVGQFEGQVLDDSKALVAEFDEDGRRGLASAIAERESGNTANELVYAVFARDGRRIGGSMDASMPKLGWSNLVFQDPREGPDLARAFAVDLRDGSRLVVASDLSASDRIDATIIVLFGIAFAVEILLGVAGALLLGGYLRRRLSAISEAAEAIVAGNLAQRVAIGPADDEFDRLARTLNGMLDRIEALLGNLRQVSSDIAHDLRTPLASIRNRLEEGLSDGADRQAALVESVERIDDVLKLFSAILRISEIESGRARRGFASLDLAELVEELCDSYAPSAQDGGRNLSWTVENGTRVNGDRELLAQALINLLDNALIHTPVGSSVHVDLTGRNGAACLTVADDGPGVPEGDRRRILQRFLRLEASRSTPGYGLGLSLVQAIAKLHGAQLEIGSNDPGLKVTLRFALESEAG